MKIESCFLLALLLVSIQSQGIYGSFSLSWFGGFCIYKPETCDDEKLALWDHQSFTIHGLWPYFQSDFGSSSLASFDINIIKHSKLPNLLDDMSNYWPPQSNSGKEPYFLWEHEWEGNGGDSSSHGYAYASALKATQPGRFKDDTDGSKYQLAFFEDTITLYKKMKGNRTWKMGSESLTRGDLARSLGLKGNDFYVTCLKGTNQVRELKVCYQTSASGNSVVTCKPKKDGCVYADISETLVLPGWKNKGQKRVTAYPNKNSK